MKTLKALVSGLMAAMALSGISATAQEFPNKPIRIVVPYSPGGGTDAVARMMAQRLSITLGQSVVVENKPGASANIGSEFVARAPADGYTILVTAPNFTTSEALYDKLSWRFDDFIPVIHLVRYANVLVSAPDSKMATVPEMVTRAKAAPGMMTYGSAGTGSNSHLAMELLKQRVGINPEHVPYKGSGPLKTDLLGNHLLLGVDGLGGMIELIKNGQVKALAVLAPRRTPLWPDVPSLGDFGINDVDGNGWYGALLPAGTPPAVVAKLHSAFAAALAMPEMRERLMAMGVEPVGGSSESFRTYLLGERRKWSDVINTAKIKVN
ncbi:MAG: tripartite tricarboxylate transporter substrate binding protein [Burkholderiales bacterium]|nr:tripartite tricarboxylate transporter substrate binding protein [Burkholderiales bacterium]